MIETLSVSLSGTAFSFLLYENLKCKFSQEGFLIGELVEKEKKTITDNDQQQVHIERTIRVSCAVPCPQLHYFYGGLGIIDAEKIQTLLGKSSTKVIAWYIYKKGALNISLTFREKLIHKQLSELFNIPLEMFSCCLLTSDNTENRSTHSFNQTFIRFNNTLDQLPLHIVNLSDSNNCYKSPERVSETFRKIISKLNINHEKSKGINIITQIQNALYNHTDSLVDELAEAEKRLFQLENEVEGLIKDRNGASMETESELNVVTSREYIKVKQNNISVRGNSAGQEIQMETDSTSPISTPTKTRGREKSTSPIKSKQNNSTLNRKQEVKMETDSVIPISASTKTWERQKSASPTKAKRTTSNSAKKGNTPTREITTSCKKKS